MPLGKGLSALIPPAKQKEITEESLVQTGERVLQLPVTQIKSNPDQPRKKFDRFALEELTASIRKYGIIQPLIVTHKERNEYELVAGERRLRSAQMLGMDKVPAIVRQAEDIEKLELSLIENIQRENLNPLERAKAYQRLISEFNLTQEEVAERVGKARSSVANTLRLLTLPEVIQDALEEGKINEGHARALLAKEDKDKQQMLLRRILGLGLTVRETENIVQGKKVSPSTAVGEINSWREQEEELSRRLGTKVRIKEKKKGGKIIIQAYTIEELHKLIDQLNNLSNSNF